MRKILTLMAAIGLTATTATSVVSCGNYKSAKLLMYKSVTSINQSSWTKTQQANYIVADFTKINEINNPETENRNLLLDGELSNILQENKTSIQKLAASGFADFTSAYEKIKNFDVQYNSFTFSNGNYIASFWLVNNSSKNKLASDLLQIQICNKENYAIINDNDWEDLIDLIEKDANKPKYFVINISDNKPNDYQVAKMFLNVGSDIMKGNDVTEATLVGASYWNGVENSLIGQFINFLKTDNSSKKHIYIPGFDENNRSYYNLENQFRHSASYSNFKSTFRGGIIGTITNVLIPSKILTENNYQLIGSYKFDYQLSCGWLTIRSGGELTDA